MQSPNNVQNYNRYTYVLNNPLSLVNPSGHFFGAIMAIGAAIAGAVSAIVGANLSVLSAVLSVAAKMIAAAVKFTMGVLSKSAALGFLARSFLETIHGRRSSPPQTELLGE